MHGCFAKHPGEKKLKGEKEGKKHKSNSCHGLFPATSFCFNHYSSLVLY